MEKEIRDEYVAEGNPIWENVDNFVNEVTEVIDKLSTAFSSAIKKFK